MFTICGTTALYRCAAITLTTEGLELRVCYHYLHRSALLRMMREIPSVPTSVAADSYRHRAIGTRSRSLQMYPPKEAIQAESLWL